MIIKKETECEECEGKGYIVEHPTADGGPNDSKPIAKDCPICDGKGTIPYLAGKTIAIDFDGVLARYEKWEGIYKHGHYIEGSIDLIESLLDAGAEVFLYTTRMNTDVNRGYTIEELRKALQSWLRSEKFPIGLQIYTKPGKPIADLYIDDRAYYHPTNDKWFDDEIEQVFDRLKED